MNNGDISEHVCVKFLQTAKWFIVSVATFLQKWCLIDGELLASAECLVFDLVMAVGFSSVVPLSL